MRSIAHAHYVSYKEDFGALNEVFDSPQQEEAGHLPLPLALAFHAKRKHTTHANLN